VSDERLVAGVHAVREVVRARPGDVVLVYLQANQRKELRQVFQEARSRGVRTEERSKDELDALAEGTRHQGAVAVVGPYPYVDLDALLGDAKAPPLLVALDQITDPHNFGAIVRSAVVFGVDGLIVLERRAAPVTPVVVRASAGATEHARIARVVNLARTLDALHDRGIASVGLAAEGEVLVEDLPPAPEGRVLVVGAEGKGLRRLVRERCQTLARIAQVGPVASLNASVAAGIAMHAAVRRR
jgi:23S rRNA (guanosine2251-2'-O)-methyltransferase